MNRDLRNATRDAARAVLWDRGNVVYAIWWVGLLIAGLVVDLVVRAVAGDFDTSPWEFAGGTPKAMMLGLGAFMCTWHLPQWVGHGIPRRAFSLAAGSVVAGGALAGAILIAIGYAIESVVAAPKVWAHGHLFTSGEQWHVIVVEYTLLFVAWAVSGWLAGAGYYRWRWRAGTLFVVVAALPLVAAEALARAAWPSALATSAIVAVVVAGALAAYGMVRNMPLRPGWTA